jgi:hypothetical protein
MGLFDFIKDPAGEIADEVKDGTEFVAGNIGKIGEAAVLGVRESVRGKEVQIISWITVSVLVVAGWKALRIIYPPSGIYQRRG